MSKLPVKDMQGALLGEHDVADELLVFDRGAQVMHDAVVAYNANQREGNACTKTRGEVSGSNAKPWKQKGLGRARSGEKRSPIWRGGGIVFGPRPRGYGKKLSRKSARLAFRRAFSEKVAAGQVTVVDSLVLSEPRTKLFAQALQRLETRGATLVLIENLDANLLRASRNIPKVAVMQAADACVYDLLRYPTVLVAREAMPVLEKRLSAEGRKG